MVLFSYNYMESKPKWPYTDCSTSVHFLANHFVVYLQTNKIAPING